MLAIDTNLVIRYLVADDASQAAKARKLIDGNDVFVCTTVMLETEWVLRSVYGFTAPQCAKALAEFAGMPRVMLEDTIAVTKALGWVSNGIDFADGLYLAKAEQCEAFVTFDRDFARVASALGSVAVRAP
jgi:predicted nucleic-acid-binding protein